MTAPLPSFSPLSSLPLPSLPGIARTHPRPSQSILATPTRPAHFFVLRVCCTLVLDCVWPCGLVAVCAGHQERVRGVRGSATSGLTRHGACTSVHTDPNPEAALDGDGSYRLHSQLHAVPTVCEALYLPGRYVRAWFVNVRLLVLDVAAPSRWRQPSCLTSLLYLTQPAWCLPACQTVLSVCLGLQSLPSAAQGMELSRRHKPPPPCRKQ